MRFLNRMAQTGVLLALLPASARAATYFVGVKGSDNAAGAEASPWRTIQHAADAVHPGDTIEIGPGIYRESIRLHRGGASQAPVNLIAKPGARVVITGADRLRNWTHESGSDPIYSHEWPYLFPIGGNPDGTPALTHPGDREHELTGRAEQVIENDRLLRQVLRREQLSHGTFYVDL